MSSIIYNKEDFKTLEPTKVLELEPSFLEYNRELELLLCSLCDLALLNSKAINKHIKEKHSSTKVTKTLLNNLESYSIKSYLDSNTRIPNNTYYFKNLPLVLKGYRCYKCSSFLTTSYIKLRKHLVNIEGLKATSTKKREDIGNTITPLQVLYPSLNKGLFIPKLPIIGKNSLKTNTLLSRESSSSSSSNTSSRSNSLIEEEGPSSSLYIDYKSKKEDLLNRSKEIGDTSLTSNKALSSFLKSSRFNLFLENKNIKDLLELISPFNKEDKVLDLIYTFSYNLSYKISRVML
jgi:Orsellinic acid/F9775 biosynthesis cluster protein D